MDVIHGDLTEHEPIFGTLTPVDGHVFNGSLTALETQVVGGSLSMVLPQYDYYEGETVVIPKGHEGTILETAGKTMRSDVMVTEVPYFETSNEAGGETVYIAREV